MVYKIGLNPNFLIELNDDGWFDGRLEVLIGLNCYIGIQKSRDVNYTLIETVTLTYMHGV